MFRHQPLQPHQAGVAEQVRPDLALFEVGQEDAVNPPRQQPGQVGLEHRQRQPAQILAVADQDVDFAKQPPVGAPSNARPEC